MKKLIAGGFLALIGTLWLLPVNEKVITYWLNSTSFFKVLKTISVTCWLPLGIGLIFLCLGIVNMVTAVNAEEHGKQDE